MTWLFGVLFVLLMAYRQFRTAKQANQWSWLLFLGILAAAGLFIFGVLIPIIGSRWMNTHPGVLIGSILLSILLFVTALIFGGRYVARRWYPNGTVGDGAPKGSAGALKPTDV